MNLKPMLPILILFGFSFTKAQTADEIVSKYISKIGGVEKWRALKTIKATAKLTMQGAEIPAIMYKKPKAMTRADIRANGVEIITSYDGKEGWMLNPMMSKEPIKLNEEQSKELIEEFEDEFIDYKKKGHEITLLGTEEVDGIKCFKIQLILNKNNNLDDSKEIHYFDTETYLPVLEITYQNQENKTIEMKRYIGDFRDVKGLMFSFFEETKVADQSFEKVTIEKIELNEPIEDSFFSFPKK